MEYIIYCGDKTSPIITLNVDKAEVMSGERNVDLISDELSVDNFSPAVHYQFHAKEQFCDSTGEAFCDHSGEELYGFYNYNPVELPYGLPMWLYKADTTETLIGRYYIEKVERTSKDGYLIDAMSVIGLMDTQIHLGNIYKGIRFVDLIAEIFGGTVGALSSGKYPVTGGVEDVYVDANIADIKIYGWLPYDSRRNNLHQVLFSTGTAMIRDSDFNIVFTALLNMSASSIPQSRIYIGGQVAYDATASGVQITEHSYLMPNTTELSTILNNTAAYSEAASNALITFSEPILISSVTTEGGITIHSISANHAYVSGRGKINAKVYTHLTRDISKDSGKLPKNIKQYSGCTLISPLNSENVLERLYQFNTGAFVTKASVVIEDEKPGALYSFTDEFGDQTQAILSKMNFNISSNIKGECEFVRGWTPSIIGNNYNNSLILTGSGTWTVPQTLRESDFPYIRVSLIGAGSGGEGGEGGTQGKGTVFDAESDPQYSGFGGGAGGNGGKGGTGGKGGRVINFNRIDISDVHHITYSCGTKGNKGTKGIGGYGLNDPVDPVAATAGGHSTLQLYSDNNVLLASYSTLQGEYLPSGVPDVITDKIYALPGKDGYDGKNGGAGGAAAFGAVGDAGEDFDDTYKGGKGSKCIFEYIEGTQLQALAGGGGGGGAAYKASGSDAQTDATAVARACCWGGDAGAGATPGETPLSAQDYGCGGDGGHGGGGGGTGGAQNWRPLNSGIRDGTPGSGGNGTDGGDGANGCVFLYHS